jgi:hypothetical protein
MAEVGKEITVVEPEPEVLTGEVVGPERTSVRWRMWDDMGRMCRHFDVEIDDNWYHHADRTEVQMLDAAFETIRMLADGSSSP